MEIKTGQIWKRIDPLLDNFPKKGWKVQIVFVSKWYVTHCLVEYNGKPRIDRMETSHFVDDFLSMYELEEE